jgi:hypothetical protein
MPNISDQSLPLFTATALTTAFQDSPAVEVKEIGRVTLLGTLALAPATFITLRPEVSSDGTNWRPITDFGSAVAAAGISTREALDQEIKRTITGALPGMTVEPDAAFFRVRAKSDVNGAVLTLAAYLASQEQGK